MQGKNTVVEGLDSRQVVDVLLNDLSELVHQLAALCTWAVQAPCRLVRLACSDDGAFKVGRGGLGHLGNRLAGAWI